MFDRRDLFGSMTSKRKPNDKQRFGGQDQAYGAPVEAL